MNYETEIIDGRKAVVRHNFEPHEIQVGSHWAHADGSKGYVTVEGFNYYGSTNPYDWDVVYSYEMNGVKKTWQKEMFMFQTRYCLIVEDEE
jgi:hypothetical protein